MDMRQVVQVAACSLFLLLVGCVSFKSGGTRHHVLLGFGLVSVYTNTPTLTVVKSTTVGLGASAFPKSRFTAGFSESLTVMAATNQSVVIEIGKVPGQPFRIETQ